MKNNTTSSSSITKPSTHFLLASRGGDHFVVAFLIHWEGASIWVTETKTSREEVMALAKPNLNTGDWTPMKTCSIADARKYYATLMKDNEYKPFKH